MSGRRAKGGLAKKRKGTAAQAPIRRRAVKSAGPSTDRHDTETRYLRYAFLDIVRFSRTRSVEAQTDIITSLNGIVREAVSSHVARPAEVIYLPTGDGVCISVLDPMANFDIHLTISLGILALLDEWNRHCSDDLRRFGVRIGLNENVDNVVIDINGQRNVAGAGINIAAASWTWPTRVTYSSATPCSAY